MISKSFFVCRVCATRLGGKLKEIDALSHLDKCDVCHQQGFLLHSADWEFPKKKEHEDKSCKDGFQMISETLSPKLNGLKRIKRDYKGKTPKNS